jgi:hypothetical protein
LSNLERFAEKYGLQVSILVINNTIHFNPATFSGASVSEVIQYPGIKGNGLEDDPETAYAVITDAGCPLSDSGAASDELVLIRVYKDGTTDTYEFPILDAMKEQIADLERLGFRTGGK